MATKVRFQLNRSGVAELMKSAEMVSIMEEYGSKALSTLGDGYEMNTHIGRNRANVEIEAVTYKAKRDNLENNTILKAVL